MRLLLLLRGHLIRVLVVVLPRDGLGWILLLAFILSRDGLLRVLFLAGVLDGLLVLILLLAIVLRLHWLFLGGSNLALLGDVAGVAAAHGLEGEAAVLATTEEAKESPNKGADEQEPMSMLECLANF